MITSKFSRENLRVACQVIQRKLDEAALELGIDSVKLGNIRFLDNSFTSKVEAIRTNQPLSVSPLERRTPLVIWTKNNVEPCMSFKWATKKNVFYVTSVNEYNVSCKTQRGTSYIVRYDQLNTMIKL